MKKGGKGKKFEGIIEEGFNKITDIQFIRLKDDNRGFKGVANPCDFLVYHKPYLYALECKSVHTNTFPFTNITDFQWKSLLEMSEVKGVKAGVIVWFVNNDETLYLSIKLLKRIRDSGKKSIHSYPEWLELVEAKDDWTYLVGRKKRTYFDYDMEQFLNEMEDKCW